MSPYIALSLQGALRVLPDFILISFYKDTMKKLKPLPVNNFCRIVVARSLSRVWLSVTPWTTAHQVSSFFTVSWSLLRFMSIESVMHPTISSFVAPFSFCPQSFSASGSFPVSQLFTSGGQSIVASASASVLPMTIQGSSPVGFTGWSSCCPRDSQESSPAPEFESINSFALSLFYGLALTSVHDYWKNHSFDYTDICWQSNVSAF